MANLWNKQAGRVARSLRQVLSFLMVVAFVSGAIAHSAHANVRSVPPPVELGLSAPGATDDISTAGKCVEVCSCHCCCAHASLPLAEVILANDSMARDFPAGTVVSLHDSTRALEAPPPRHLT
jgi:hypothetical protein